MDTPCIDPRLLLFASGAGFDDPTYGLELPEQEDSQIELFGLGEVQQWQKEPETAAGLEREFLGKEPFDDAGDGNAPQHIKSSTLRPEADVFVPTQQRPFVRLSTTPRGPRSSSRVRPTTPRSPHIVVSPAQHTSFDSRVHKRERRPSIRSRTPSLSCGRQNFEGSMLNLETPTVRTQHMPDPCRPAEISPGVEQWAMNAGYHLPSSQIPSSPAITFSAAEANPGLTYSAPTVISSSSQASSGYRCFQPGCKLAANGRIFDLPSELKKHEKSHMTKAERPLACDACQQRFYDKRDLNRHRETHEGQTMLCPICGTTIGRNDNLPRHQKSQQCQRALWQLPAPSQSSAMSSSVHMASRPQPQPPVAGASLPASPPTAKAVSRGGATMPELLYSTVVRRGRS